MAPGPLLYFAACAVAATVAAGPPVGPTASDPTAKIVVEPGPTYVIVAEATSEAPVTGTYELSVEKVGPAGRSTSRQSGAFELAPGHTGTLSTVRVNVSRGDSLKARLRVDWSSGPPTTDMVELHAD